MRKLISINDTCRILGVGKTKTYDLLNAGALRSVMIDGRRFIVVDSVDALTGGAA